LGSDNALIFSAQSVCARRCTRYVSAREWQRAETYTCASSRANALCGKDRRVIGPSPKRVQSLLCSLWRWQS